MIKENLEAILKDIPDNVKLVAVSKTKPVELIIEAYNAGQRIFGENKVQELADKNEKISFKGIEWHYIGHLQTNKVKYIAPFVSLIHAVDSLKLMKEIEKQAFKNNRNINCLLQFHIAEEDTKFGLNLVEAFEILDSKEFQSFKSINICGVMGMGTYTDDMDLVRREFINLRSIFAKLKAKYFTNNPVFKEISMGMSNDYKIAIEEGSTMIRIGSDIFGERNY